MHQYRCKNDIYNFFKISEVFNLVLTLVMCRAYNLVLTVHNSVFFQLVYSRKGYLLNEKSEFSKYASSKCYA